MLTGTVFSATDRSGQLSQTHLEEINKRTETVSNRDGSKQRWKEINKMESSYKKTQSPDRSAPLHQRKKILKGD